jgi:hypothetical protein
MSKTLTLKKSIILYPAGLFAPSAPPSYPDNPKFNCNLLISEGSTEFSEIETAIRDVAKQKWAEIKDPIHKTWESKFNHVKMDSQKCCWVPSDKKPDHMVLKAKNKDRPKVFTPSMESITEDVNNTYYSGWIVAAKVKIYVPKSDGCISSLLLGVKFLQPAEPISADIATADDFSDITPDVGDDAWM